MSIFQVGDVLLHIEKREQRKVIKIVHETETVYGKWISGDKFNILKTCYVFEMENGFLTWVSFGGEYLYEFVSRQGDIQSVSNFCPRCNEELKDHMSFGLGEMIKKCGNCGWC